VLKYSQKIPSVYKMAYKDAKPGRAPQFFLKYARRLRNNDAFPPTSPDRATIVSDCRMADDPASMSLTIRAHVYDRFPFSNPE
jgi:hypothetical protein